VAPHLRYESTNFAVGARDHGIDDVKQRYIQCQCELDGSHVTSTGMTYDPEALLEMELLKLQQRS
jgi:hypothetical protein